MVPLPNDADVVADWDRKEEETRQETDRQNQLNEVLNPSRKPLHRFFYLIRMIAGGFALAMAVGQFLDLVLFANRLTIVQYVLRVYVVGLCVLVVLNEMQWTSFTTGSQILSNWVTRGIFYAFVGVLGLAENDSTDNFLPQDAPELYLTVVAWMMIASGCIYFLMGITCLQFFKKRMDEEYDERLQHAQHAQRNRSLLAAELPVTSTTPTSTTPTSGIMS